jgi:hypothetical protein
MPAIDSNAMAIPQEINQFKLPLTSSFLKPATKAGPETGPAALIVRKQRLFIQA